MNKILIGALIAVGVGAAAVAIVAGSGVVDIGADAPHSPLVNKVLEFGREQSIARRAAGIVVPDDIDNPERIRRGAGNYDAMCVNCHLLPDLPDTEIRKGLYPAPPNLALKIDGPGGERSHARDFWVIKHGIKASGMPAWSKGGMDDEAIWDLTAFLQRLPGLAKADYELLVAASDGHTHGGQQAPTALSTSPESVDSPKKAAKRGTHDHSTHPH